MLSPKNGVSILQEPEARDIGGRVVGGVTQRLAARLLQQLLRPAGPVLTPST